MPYVNIQLTDEAVSAAQKAELISGTTQLLFDVLGKDPRTTFVVIEQMPIENWGVGGLPVAEYRAKNLK